MYRILFIHPETYFLSNGKNWIDLVITFKYVNKYCLLSYIYLQYILPRTYVGRLILYLDPRISSPPSSRSRAQTFGQSSEN